MRYSCIAALALGTSLTAHADIVSLTPVADAFVSSAQPAGNFGGAGALALAAPGLPQGEFQTLIRFDTGPAISTFNASYGAGNWVITNISLVLTSTAPGNPIFNASAAGQFRLSWMQNDSWVEGTGGPGSPGATGINFQTLPSFLSPADESLGVFNYGGGTSGTVPINPAITPALAGDVGLGGPVSFRLSPEGSSVAWVFNSRSFGTVASRPALLVTAVPAPASGALAAVSLLVGLRRRRTSTIS